MTFSEYQKESRRTAGYTLKPLYIYPTLGLVGEAGEVAEKIKKLIRDKNQEVSDADREAIKKELGDVLWYMAQVATELKINLNDVAQNNLDKIFSRLERNLIHGDGDNR
jgi:NTP pyrophosphatase (non-canonical NTP hydrolase)